MDINADERLLWEQNDCILKEIENNTKEQPLTSIRYPLYDYCKNTFNNNNNNDDTNNYEFEIHSLTNEYKFYRSIRGDGNCYYRAFLYNLVDAVVTDITTNTNNSTSRAMTLIQWIKNDSYQYLINIGQYNEMTIEIFYDTIVELFDTIITNTTKTTTTTNNNNYNNDFIHTMLNEENSTSDYCVWYLRILTSTYIRSDPQRFVPFIFFNDNSSSSVSSSSLLLSLSNDPTDIVTSYCQKEIEPMNKECEQIQVLALAECFCPNLIQVRIEYVHGRPTTTSTTTDDAQSTTTTTTSKAIVFGATTTTTKTTTATNNNNTSSTNTNDHDHDDDNNNNNITVEVTASEKCMLPYELTFLYRPGHYDILYKE